MADNQAAEGLGMEIDIGNLLLLDPRPISSSGQPEASDLSIEAVLLKEMTQLSQILLNRLWTLPLERIEDAIVATLPSPTTVLPREKPIPKPKPLTKWEKYAKEKGIKKAKLSRMVWDQQTREWKPRWGYGKAVQPEDDWVAEIPEGADESHDPFEQRQKAKRERVAKNELQRLKNVARAHKTKVPAGGILPHSEGQNSSKSQIGQAAAFARNATASFGKFTETLSKEKPLRNTGKKRKFESNQGDQQNEKTRMMGILNGINNKKPKVDGEQALGRVKRRSEKLKRSHSSQDESGSKRPFGGHSGGKKFGGKGGGMEKKGGQTGGRPGKGPANQKSRKPVKSAYRG